MTADAMYICSSIISEAAVVICVVVIVIAVVVVVLFSPRMHLQYKKKTSLIATSWRRWLRQDVPHLLLGSNTPVRSMNVFEH